MLSGSLRSPAMTSARYLKSTSRFQAKKLRAQRNRPGIGDLRKDCSRRMAGGFGVKAKTEKEENFFFFLSVVSLSSGLVCYRLCCRTMGRRVGSLAGFGFVY